MAITDSFYQNNIRERFSYDGSAVEDFANMKTLVGDVIGNDHCTPKETGGSAGYTPPTGKQFIAVAILVSAAAGGDTCGLQTAGSDVGNNSASAPTGTDLGASVANLPTTATNSINLWDYHMILPAGRYFYFFSPSRHEIMIVGFEVSI